MAGRTVYGNDTSSNGWPMVDEGSCEWTTVPGTDPPVKLEIQQGWPLAILRAFAADFNAYVEHLNDSDSACWTADNSVSTSNHLSGTAMDLNWDDHPFQVADAGFDPAKIATIREMLDFYEGTVFWGNDWDSPKDAMHFQLGSLENGGPIDTFNNQHTQDFIDRKIRPDGFSTFRRGATPIPPLGPQVMTVPVVQNTDGTWTSPSPAWAHLIMRESSGNPTIIQQVIDVNSGGNEAEGLFQITPATWRDHRGDEFAPSARLATPQQQAIVAARIFTANPSGSDWGAGLPGREDAAALAAGLVPLIGPPPPPPPQPGLTMEQMVRELHAVWCTDRVASTSIYGDPTIKWFRKDKFDNMDGFLYDVWTERKAALGDQQALAQIRAAAASSPIAAAMLKRLTTTPPKESNPTPPSQPPTPPPTPPVQPPAPPTTPPVQQPTPPVPPQTGTLTAAIASLQAFKQGLQRLIGG